MAPTLTSLDEGLGGSTGGTNPLFVVSDRSTSWLSSDELRECPCLRGGGGGAALSPAMLSVVGLSTPS